MLRLISALCLILAIMTPALAQEADQTRAATGGAQT